MSDKSVKGFHPQGLDLFYAMYAIGLVFGIEQISEALYKNVSNLLQSKASASHVAVNAALFLAILLLIIRFFWSTGNIKRAWERVEDHHSRVTSFFIIIHLPALLIQAVLVLFLCFAFAQRISADAPTRDVILWFVSATAWNAIWLIVLTRGKKQRPESIWIANNTILVAIGFSLWFALHNQLATDTTILPIFVVASLTSSLFDLYNTADTYMSDLGR